MPADRHLVKNAASPCHECNGPGEYRLLNGMLEQRVNGCESARGCHVGDAAVEAAERLVTERRAAAGTSASVERNVNAVLGKTQRLQALLRAAQTRATKAEVAAERAETEAAEAAAAILREPEAARKQAWLELEAAQAALDAHTATSS